MATYNWPAKGSGSGSGNLPSTLLVDKATISSGANSVSVTFGTAFTVTPFVVVSLWNTTDSNPDQISVIGTSETTTGFTVTLSANAPNGNYFINWMAASVND